MQNKHTLFLVFHGRYPSEKAASLFAAKSAEAFVMNGMRTILLVPRRIGRAHSDHESFYKLKHGFPVVYIPTIDVIPFHIAERIAFRISLTVFSVCAFVYLLFRASRRDIVYSNETLPLLLASFRFSRTCYEMHDYPERALWLYRLLFKRIQHVLITNNWKLGRFKQAFPQSASKAFLEPNAVDIKEFDVEISKEDARKMLSLPSDKNMVVYTGHLYPWKGVDTLAEATSRIEADTYIVGGTQEDVLRFTEKWGSVPNLHIVGFRPHDEMPLWQKAADALALPNTAKEEISAHYTSPMKLFEYMASGTPIVASDIPSIREITGDERAVLVAADNTTALTAGIHRILGAENLDRARAARAWVHEHSWKKRAERILLLLT